MANVLSFNGQGTYVEVQEDPFPDPTAFTISLWVRSTVLNDGGFHGLIGKQDAPDKYHKPSMYLMPSAGGLHYDSYAPDGTRYGDVIDNFFEKDKWLHITWVKRGTKYEFYRNGELFTERAAPQSISTSKSSYWIGKIDNHWIGQISEVRIWKVASSKEEIQKNMRRRLNGEEPGLVAYWPLDDGTSQVAIEKSSRKNHGIFHGATWDKAEVPITEPTEATQEVRSLSASLDQAKQKLDASEKALEARATELTQARQELQGRAADLDHTRQRLDTSEMVLEECSKELEQTRKELQGRATELAQIREKLDASEKTLEARDAELAQARQELQRRAEELEQIQNQLAAAKQAPEGSAQEHDALQAELAQARERLTQLTQLNDRVRSCEDALRVRTRQRDANQSEIELLRAELSRERVKAAANGRSRGRLHWILDWVDDLLSNHPRWH